MNPLAKYLLDAHNVDHLLFAEQNDLGLKKIKNEFNQLKKIESQLSNIVHGIITCSAIDFNIFHHLNSSSLKGIVVPNGVDINRNTFQVFKDNNTPRLLFCGSLDYGPNKEGIIWFANEVWPLVLKQFKNATLTIIGRNPSRDTISFFSGIQGINFIGPVKDVRLFYKECTISIVPIFTGSGTRLKILEAMALGIPVVSTSKGAEGIDIEDGKNIVIADNKTVMYKSICYLLFNSTFYYTIRKEARLLVEENYSWTKNGILLNNYINEIHIK
jgi:glycosyltransferase involved in cell wall biosynthesis